MIMIGFKCLGSSCLDLGLASVPDCLASASTSLPRSRSCLASVLAVAALPLPWKFCLGICLCLEKNALTTTLAKTYNLQGWLFIYLYIYRDQYDNMC